MKLYLSVICLLYGLVIGLDTITDGQETTPERTNANEVVDTLLRLLKKRYKPPMKPIPIGNRTISINDRLGLFMPIMAEFRIKNGAINEIGRLDRVGDNFITEYEDESTLLEVKMGLIDVRFNSSFDIDIMRIVHRDMVEGSVDMIGIAFDLISNGTTGDRTADNVEIFDISGVQMSLVGRPRSLLRRHENLALQMAVDFVMKTNLKYIVNSIVTAAAGDTIKSMADGSYNKKRP